MNKDVLNTIHYGDFLNKSALIGKRKFDVVIADPPYNIGKDFGNDSDKQTLESYLAWVKDWLAVCMRHLSENGVVYVYGFPEILAHIAVQYPMDKQRWLVWHYTNKTVPRLKFWQRSHESILCLWNGKRPDLNIDPIREGYTEGYKHCIGKVRKAMKCRYGGDGQQQTIYNGHENGALPRDVLKVPALAGGAGAKERWFVCRDCGNKIYPPQELAQHRDCDTLKHPTQKPMELTRRLLQSAVNGKGVLIPFAGSGSECVVARQIGARFFATEINREYVSFGNKWLKKYGFCSK
ncbi:MAG: DNA-methyltransferase [Gammaproteobacteria bacterium]